MKGAETRYSRKDLWQNEKLVKKLGIHKRSITPDTLEGIIFDNSEEDLYYREYYNYKDNKVTHFAINENLLPSSKFLDSNKVGSWKSSKKEDAIKTNADRVPLDKIEVDLISTAVFHMIKDKVNTVVIDIFARDQGKIKFKNSFVETHAIVLHKFLDNKEISIIDPSNFQFSCHLANLNNFLEKEWGVKFITKYSMDKIYIAPSDDDKVGPLPIQHRDCIDIAVKVALGLNNNKDKADLSNILGLRIIKEITNNPEIDNNIIDLDTPIRVKQATQSSIRYNFELLIDKIQKLFKHSLVINNDEKGDLYRNYEKWYKDLLQNKYDYDKYDVCISSLSEIHKSFYKEVSTLIGEQHTIHLDLSDNIY